MKSYRTFSVLLMSCVICTALVFCAKKKNPAKWDNPQDNTGENWHPPTVQVMEGGAVAYRDTLYVTATASDSNGTILDYCWDINGAGYFDTTLTGTLDVYLPDTGWYTVRVKVRDNDKLCSQPDSVLLYATFHPPVVVGVPDFAVSIYDTFTLTATGADSNGVITKYLWALDGVNYTEETMAGSLRTVFDTEGVKSVKVRAVDDDNLQSLPDEIRVTVRLDAPEVTAMDDITVSIFDTIGITATASDPNGNIVSYHWAFDGLHFVDSTDTGFVQHAFDSAGTYDVKVKVKDDDGIFGTDDGVLITVNTDAPSVVAMDDFSTSVFDTVVLTATGSDTNGEVVRYLWALDGTDYRDTTVAGTLKTVFSTDGVKVVRVMVMDDDGIISAADEILVSVALNAPTVVAMDDTVVTVGVDETLRATGSDANGRIVRYYWALDGVTFADSTGTGVITHLFAVTGNYPVKVKVMDDDGLISNESVITLHVKDAYPRLISPIQGIEDSGCELSWSPGSYTAGYRVLLDTVNPPAVVAGTTAADTYVPERQLVGNKTYYWMVIGVSDGGLTAESPVENFRTPDNNFVDARDGRLYRLIAIGTQVWMAENLKYGQMINHDVTPASDDGIVQKYCYGDLAANCDTFGGLYCWTEAVQNSASGIGPGDVQGVCPDGWHLPSDDEWKQLELYIGVPANEIDERGYRGDITDLKPGGTFDFGFTYPGFMIIERFFTEKGNDEYYWTSTVDSTRSQESFGRGIRADSASIERSTPSWTEGRCVRCIRN